MWIQKGWQAPEELDISSLLSISEGWFLSVSSAKHWTKRITHSRMPQFQSINSFFNLLLCQVLTCLAHSLQNAALPPSLFLLSKLKLPPWVVLGGWRGKSLLAPVHLLSLPTTGIINFLLCTSDKFFSSPAYIYFLSQ